MRKSIALAAALASAASAQSATALTFWRPGLQNNPSRASKLGLETSTYSPIASIISSNPATTVFALGCPTSAPLVSTGPTSESCTWTADAATYTIVDKTKYIAHQTVSDSEASIWWSCDYDGVKTRLACDMEVAGNVNDNTGGPVSFEFPDEAGNVVAFVTAEVVTAGSFGQETMSWGVGTESVVATGLRTASGSAPTATATQRSSSGTATTASSTASGSAAASTGAAAGFGVEAVRLAALVGGAAFAAW